MCYCKNKVLRFSDTNTSKENTLHCSRSRVDTYGYGAFSVNPSEVEIVIKYIVNQKEHHSKNTFKNEYKAVLKKYNVEYDERYVWD